MVTKKKVEEMKKFNQELEKYFPKMEFDFLRSGEVFNETKVNQDQEFSTLLANNLFDLKTEVALLRKNMVDTTQGVVMKLMGDQQQLFFNEVNKFQNKVFVEMKNNFASYITEITSELSNVKKEFNRLALVNEQTNKDISEIRSQLNSLINDKLTESMSIKKEIGEVLSQQNVQFDRNVNLLNLKINKIAENQNLLLDDNLKKVNLLSGSVSNLKTINNYSNSVNEFRDNSNYQQLRIDVRNSRDDASEMGRIASEKEMRILDIDEKLRKLESLK